LDVPFWKYLSDEIHQEAAKQGVDVQDYDSRNDAATQLKNAQDAITKKVDAIIISPTDSSSAPAVLKEAEQAKIPVIIADIGTDSGNYDSFVISSNKTGAKEAGDYLAKYLASKGFNKGPVGEITISLARINGQNRTGGFKEAMDATSIPILDMKQSQKYTRAEGETFAQDLMTAHPDLHAIFSQHDEATLGALKAIETAKKQDQVVLAGFDGSPETVDAIKAGKIVCASMQQPVLMGKKAFDAAEDIFNGEKPEKEIDVPTILVTKDNVNQLEKQLADTVFPKQ
jgi:ribose transport system substrate-binding protein